ncbi:hypothetical protein F5B22DRAFT_625619 [Xylaria bambusicola]|uniref:uncharacterized protein n=1 Tax=Xylaria bambusicola TaxID=326684 RepID=UPI0020072F68|nr:uncharacterized protein F5B22DRAFT_625619 [Xylaria bambusicola]KAI0506081.1 hypothetical protein F5B22DRAFT_625619 [Xylaria bambusicola]
MNCTSLRFARQVRTQCSRKTVWHPSYRGVFGSQPNRRITGAAYSSLARQSSEGKSVIITGSSRGIGKAIALRLATDGYNVCVSDLGANRAGCEEVAKEIRSMGRKACVAMADVTNREEVKKMIQTSVRELGPLNTMIANAGIVQVIEPLLVSEKDFQHMFSVNVFGVQNCLAEAAKQLIEQGNCQPDSPGKLLAASSIVGFRSFPLLPHYSASKWAVRGLVEAYAMNLAEKHITVNAYAPGIVETTMWDIIDAGVAERTGMAKHEVTEKMAHDMSLLHRVSVPEDVAKLVSFLASSDSDFVTGQTQLVDGGVILT